MRRLGTTSVGGTLEGMAWIWKESEGMNGGCVMMMMTTTALVGVGVVWGVRLQRQRQSEGVLLLERGTPQAQVGWHLLRQILRRRLGHADHDG